MQQLQGMKKIDVWRLIFYENAVFDEAVILIVRRFSASHEVFLKVSMENLFIRGQTGETHGPSKSWGISSNNIYPPMNFAMLLGAFGLSILLSSLLF